MINKVNFFIIGAQKAATTSLYNYLNQHPDIFMPYVKENHFFVEDRVYRQGVEHFHRFYQNYSGEKLIGGAFVHMLSSQEAPERVFKYNSEAKILVMLRNPIDRAYSAYNFAIKNGWESPKNNFLDTFKLQEKRLSGNFTERTDLSYFYVGLYAKHLSNWFKWFPKEKFLILLDADFVADSKLQMQRVFNFLNAPEFQEINTDNVYNKSGDVRIKSLHHFLRNKESRLRRNIGKVLPFGVKTFYRHHILKSIDKFNKTEKKYKPLSLEDRAAVFGYFEQDLKALSDLINADVYELWKPGYKNSNTNSIKT